MRPTRAPRRAIIAGVIMSIVVAGCGSDESASDDGTATSAATTPPTTEALTATTALPAADAPTTDGVDGDLDEAALLVQRRVDHGDARRPHRHVTPTPRPVSDRRVPAHGRARVGSCVVRPP